VRVSCLDVKEPRSYVFICHGAVGGIKVESLPVAVQRDTPPGSFADETNAGRDVLTCVRGGESNQWQGDHQPQSLNFIPCPAVTCRLCSNQERH